MLEKVRNRLLAFIESDTDTPLLSGFAVGFYMILFYYSKNFALANSWQQLLFFIGYYIALPCITLFAGYTLLCAVKLIKYRKHFLFLGVAGFLSFFLLQISALGENKRIVFAILFFILFVLSLKIARYYKALIPLLFLISIFNMMPIATTAYVAITASNEWKKLPDDIEKVIFKAKPNVYYIQPDGYTSFASLKSDIHKFDNSDYERFLKQHGFTLYNNFRSNYSSTLLSNSATFAMKHHYIAKDVDLYGARETITGDNPVLRIFRNNGYKNSFITERPYLIINRPELGFDYCNIRENELPFIRDGLDMDEDILADLKLQMKNNGGSANFYFLEKFTPSHIPSYEHESKGVKEETRLYLERVRDTNMWIKEIVAYIAAGDPEGIIIIGADHGGFAGFSHTLESFSKVTDRELIYSIFGVQTAIKWNNAGSKSFDSGLKSSINLFRTLFSFLGNETRYLDYMESDESYTRLSKPMGIYKYIDNDGNVVFEKR
jgi:hypothetical protein